MSSMLPPPIRNTRATVSPPLTDVEEAAAQFAKRGVVPTTQAASPAPAPTPGPATPLPVMEIPRTFRGISFVEGAVISDTGQAYPIDPADMPQLLDFAFRVALASLQDGVLALRDRLGLPKLGGDTDEPARADQGVPDVPGDQATQQVQEGQ